jgi:Holliday junction DNA helicase RuvA
MINHLTGNILETGKDFVVIECGGIGFRVTATTSAVASLDPGQAGVSILTYLQMREGGAELFGFASEDEREIFHSLTGIAGVGPKMGMAVLSALGRDGVIAAAVRGDEKRFASVTGIGKKLAQRMVIELPDRLKKCNLTLQDHAAGIAADGTKTDVHAMTEAVDALVSLGFSPAEAHAAVIQESKSSSDPVDCEALIKKSLAQLYGNSRRLSGSVTNPGR